MRRFERAEGGEAAKSRHALAVIPLAQAAVVVVGDFRGQLGLFVFRGFGQNVIDKVFVIFLRRLQHHARGAGLHIADLIVHAHHDRLHQIELLARVGAGGGDVVGLLADGGGVFLHLGGGDLYPARQIAHFVGHHGKAAAMLAGSGGLDGGVEREQIGLVRDFADIAHDGADGVDLLLQVRDCGAVAIDGAAHIANGGIHRGHGLADVAGRAVEGADHLFEPIAHGADVFEVRHIAPTGMKRDDLALRIAHRNENKREDHLAHGHLLHMFFQAAVGQTPQDGADAFRVFVELVNGMVQSVAHVGAAQGSVESGVKPLHGFARGAVHVEHAVFHGGVGLGQHFQAVERFQSLLQIVEGGGVHDGDERD